MRMRRVLQVMLVWRRSVRVQGAPEFGTVTTRAMRSARSTRYPAGHHDNRRKHMERRGVDGQVNI